MKEHTGFSDCLGQDIYAGDYLRLLWRNGKFVGSDVAVDLDGSGTLFSAIGKVEPNLSALPEFCGVEAAFKLEV